MIEGISTNRLCESSAACLAAAGKRFAIRYHSRTTRQPEKQLRPKEAVELARAGLQLVVVYQDNARKPEDFGFARGRLDGASAIAAAGQIGQPAGSTIYFAVDTDFSASQIRAVVLPYFEAVRSVLGGADGLPAYGVGVYGSGLTCRLLQEAGLVRHTWLAEATGWRESAGYEAWSLKQFVTRAPLCDLGTGWQRCIAQVDDYGQFVPAGFDVRAGEGPIRRVTATQLNLRFVPSATGNTPIAQLPQGTLVRVLGESAPGWVRVRTVLQGATFIGHVRAEFLADLGPTTPPAPIPAPEPAPAPAPVAPAIPAVHLRENDPVARRDSRHGLALPLGEPGRPNRDPQAGADARVAQLTRIGEWLAVEQSARWAPRDGVTFCNVYAADYAYLAGCYLPRVWWTDSAIARIAAGQSVAPLYGDTVRELRADDLYVWLQDLGAAYGWKRVSDTHALQTAANAGGVGLICADRAAAGKPGHITVVVPEVPGHRAGRDAAGFVDQPLQSQAGAVNRRYGSAGSHWWRGGQFTGHVFFVHE